MLLFVNGMGGTPLLELYIIYRKAEEIARAHGSQSRVPTGRPVHHQPGNGGCTSITLLKLDTEMTRLWDAPVVTTALRWGA